MWRFCCIIQDILLLETRRNDQVPAYIINRNNIPCKPFEAHVGKAQLESSDQC
jgi:hypothetical protein